ncbi:unnamed protein product, partial [Mesorhabditis belari]|uniref:MADF domain-containing protein n=1 Tax=Mesorhabditis belari TaxID=2138241 RepID=A0AAF3ECR5_9BILA
MEAANQMLSDHQVQIHNMDAGRTTTVLTGGPSQGSLSVPSMGRGGKHSTDWQRGPAHSTVVSDEVRTLIIDAVFCRPSIWDSQREKNGPGRKQSFQEITQILNQQHHQELSCEEVEKQWKNLKDTYNKTKKKLSFDNDGRPITPKWKFFSNMLFLDQPNSLTVPIENGPSSSMMYLRARSEDGMSRKRMRDDDEINDDDQYFDFCRSILHNLRKIGEMDRMKYLQLTKSIRDMIYDAEVELLSQNEIAIQQQHSMLR